VRNPRKGKRVQLTDLQLKFNCSLHASSHHIMTILQEWNTNATEMIHLAMSLALALLILASKRPKAPKCLLPSLQIEGADPEMDPLAQPTLLRNKAKPSV
jgi:hypothetical protein